MTDRLEEIERLARLRSEGLLTNEEFEREKQRLLQGGGTQGPASGHDATASGPPVHAPPASSSSGRGALFILCGLAMMLLLPAKVPSFFWAMWSMVVAGVCAAALKKDLIPHTRRLVGGTFAYAVVFTVVSLWSAVGAWVERSDREEAAEEKLAGLTDQRGMVESAIAESRLTDAERVLAALSKQVAPSSPSVVALREKLNAAKEVRRGELLAAVDGHIAQDNWGEATKVCAAGEVVAEYADVRAKCGVAKIGDLVARAKLDDAWEGCRALGDTRSSLSRADEVCGAAGVGFLQLHRDAVLAARAAQDWEGGNATCAKLDELADGDAAVAKACEVILDEHAKAEAKKARDARAIEVEGKVAAVLAVAGDKEKCDTPLEVSMAWVQIRDVVKDDPGYTKASRAVRKLERCRKQIERSLTNGLAGFMKAQREEYASKLERAFLDEGFDIRVRAQGTRLKMTYVLFNRAWAHKLTDGGSMGPGSVLGTSEGLGFKKVVFSDGYDESYTYTLNPKNEKDAIREKAMLPDLRAPLKL